MGSLDRCEVAPEMTSDAQKRLGSVVCVLRWDGHHLEDALLVFSLSCRNHGTLGYILTWHTQQHLYYKL